MATAYLASVQGPGGFNKLVVLKKLRSSLAAEPEFLKMFLEEARLAARIEHPNVVHTTEVGFDGKNHYIAMEYLDGQSFENISRRLLKKEKANGNTTMAGDIGGEAFLPLKYHLHIVSQALSGLDAAHELRDFDGTPLNVVHRDVSPHNIVVTYDGHVKLLDFGIAKAADSSGDTRTGVMKGKCSYMPAEQFGGSQVDRRADVFAVGVILWQAITGRRLWRGMSDAEIFQKVASGDIRRPREVNPEIVPELEAICMKALAHRPDDRYATAAEFQVALDDHIAGRPELRTTARELGKFISDIFGRRSREDAGDHRGAAGPHVEHPFRHSPRPRQHSYDVTLRLRGRAPRRREHIVTGRPDASAHLGTAHGRRCSCGAGHHGLFDAQSGPPADRGRQYIRTSLLLRAAGQRRRSHDDIAPRDEQPGNSPALLRWRAVGRQSGYRSLSQGRCRSQGAGRGARVRDQSRVGEARRSRVSVNLSLEAAVAVDAGRQATARAAPTWLPSRKTPTSDTAPTAPVASSPPPSTTTTIAPPAASTLHGPQLDKSDPWARNGGH